MNPEDKSPKDMFASQWNPQPLEEPNIHPELHTLDPLTRSAQSIWYSILTIEFWISPQGQVREWFRNNTRLAVILAIPAFMVVPTITFCLWQFVSWLTALNAMAKKLVVLPLWALLAAVILTLIWTLFKHVIK